MSLANVITERSFKPFAVNTNDVSDRLIIREFVVEDITYLQEINVNLFFVHLRHTFGGAMGFLNEAMAHQKQKDRKDFYLAIVDKETSRVVGGVLVYNYNKEKRQAELGYFVDKSHQNCKFATEASVYAMHHIGGLLDLKTFYATVHPQNAYSKKLLAKLGFVQKGDVFISQYQEDLGGVDRCDQGGGLVTAPRVGLFVSYDDFLSQKNAILSGF